MRISILSISDSRNHLRDRNSLYLKTAHSERELDTLDHTSWFRDDFVDARQRARRVRKSRVTCRPLRLNFGTLSSSEMLCSFWFGPKYF